MALAANQDELLKQTARRALGAALSLFVGAPPRRKIGGNGALSGFGASPDTFSPVTTESPPAGAAVSTADLPAAAWATFAQPAKAPDAGKAWGLDQNGHWRQVPLAAGGKMVKGHYVPPQRPGGPREPASADVRFTDPKRIATTAACLANDWNAVFLGVAPRGAPDQHGVSPGIGTIKAGIDYYYEGGAIYPDVTKATPDQWSSIASRAKSLWAWWQNPPWPNWFTRRDSLGWYRVYTDNDGFRAYKPWTLEELQQLRYNFMLAAPGYQCPIQEVYRDAQNDMKASIDMHGTSGTVLAMKQVFPLARCSPSQTDQRNHYLKVGALVTGAVFGGIALAHVIASHAAAASAAASAGGSSGAGAAAGGSSLLHTVAVTAAPLAVNAAGHVVQASQAGPSDTPILDSALSTFDNVAKTAQAAGANVPALPTSAGSSSLLDWAKQIAIQHLQAQGQTVTPSDAQTLQNEIRQLQSQIVAQNGNYPSQPSSTVAPPSLQAKIADAMKGNNALLYGGLALAAIYAFTNRRR